MTRLYEKVNTLTEDVQKKHEALTHLYENANTLYCNRSRQSGAGSESRQTVLLKACGLVGLIVLAFMLMMSMCG